MPTLRIVLSACFLASLGCGPVNPPGPVDEDGKRIPVPPPGEQWLQLETISPRGGTSDAPTALALNPRFEFKLNAYIDEESVPSFEIARLSSGGLSVRGRTRYIMARKTIVWEPRQDDLIAGLTYTLTLRLDALRSATNSPLLTPSFDPTYIVDSDGLTTEMALDDTPKRWRDVEPIFEAHCNRCHNDPQWRLPRMSWFDLTNKQSQQVERPLVRPFSPSRSYLMHKLLPDYPDRLYTVHPPPWDAESTTLGEDELWTIEKWIKAGAPGPDEE